MSKYKAIGVMSGSSCDGLDLSIVELGFEDGEWSFRIQKSDCIAFPEELVQGLKISYSMNQDEIQKLDKDFGKFIGESVVQFLDSKENINVIGSHGHTVYHEPDKRGSKQIGCGETIAALTGIKTVCNFRNKDIELGGQGAPVAPIADVHLFKGYKYYLNLGGISNITSLTPDGPVAFDICSANQVLNHYASLKNMKFDEDGKLARSGKLDTSLFNYLNNLVYYKLKYPKSMCNSFTRDFLVPFINKFELSLEDKLNTYVEHLAYQINDHIRKINSEEEILGDKDAIMVSGGGAYNSYLIERIKERSGLEIVLPEKEIIDFKESILMAFMAVLKLRGDNNIYANATGALMDSCSGDIYGS